jgi:hypothetical protein
LRAEEGREKKREKLRVGGRYAYTSVLAAGTQIALRRGVRRGGRAIGSSSAVGHDDGRDAGCCWWERAVLRLGVVVGRSNRTQLVESGRGEQAVQ